jgi:tRNA (guanine37-N1)-methyltransferase
MLIDVITIFPEMFTPVIGESIIKRAQNKGLVKIKIHDLRDWSPDKKHRKVDDAGYGGGGMVFGCEPMFAAVESVLGCSLYPENQKSKAARVVLLSPQGKTLSQRTVHRLLDYERLVLLAPRYEGVDERVVQHLADEEISIGDYLISGGELAAMVLIDAVTRLIPGVVSDADSIKQESFEQSLLDWPHYTRPEDFQGLKVPEVLLGGDHKKIQEWRKKKALEATKRKRPDMLK